VFHWFMIYILAFCAVLLFLLDLCIID